jgi:hypothetical protein
VIVKEIDLGTFGTGAIYPTKVTIWDDEIHIKQTETDDNGTADTVSITRKQLAHLVYEVLVEDSNHL